MAGARRLKEVAAHERRSSSELRTIAVPTILFWGERDNFSTYEQRRELASEIPGAELRVYAGAGHSLHREEPRRSAATSPISAGASSATAPSVIRSRAG